MDTNTGIIYGVALGPGDPELITLKALRILQQSDDIYYPVTAKKAGETGSFSLPVLEQLGIDAEKLKPVEISMNYDRSQVKHTYGNLAASCIIKCLEGRKVVVVSEGDISFFSTFSYLIDDFDKAGVPFEMVPGIPAFMMCGSLGKFPLCSQDDKLLVVPQVNNEETLRCYVKANETVVLMKVSRIKEWIVPFLENSNVPFFYGEYMGTSNQFITQDINELKGRHIPYFSIIVIKKNNDGQN